MSKGTTQISYLCRPSQTVTKNLQDLNKMAKGKKKTQNKRPSNEVTALKRDLASKQKAFKDGQPKIAKLEEDLRNADVDRMDAEATIHV